MVSGPGRSRMKNTAGLLLMVLQLCTSGKILLLRGTLVQQPEQEAVRLLQAAKDPYVGLHRSIVLLIHLSTFIFPEIRFCVSVNQTRKERTWGGSLTI